MSRETLDLLKRIANERNIPLEVLEEALQSALKAATKKMLDQQIEISRAAIDPKTGEYRVYAQKTVVEYVFNEAKEISLAEARLYDIAARIGQPIDIDVTPANFGRIAAQFAKQDMTAKIRQAEKEMVYARYHNRVGELVSGSVQQYEKGNVILDIGYAEALLPHSEQGPTEKYHFGDRVRAIILSVKQEMKEPQVVVSRKSHEFIKKLFEQEVSEVRDGTVVIKGVARDAGKRTKIAVSSTNLDVDPVGACVGMKGSRVQTVVQELKGERIDIIPYSADRSKFVANSLKPAEVDSVDMAPDGRSATLIVKDDQLSLAIGKGGINAKLAHELTGVHITILTVSEMRRNEKETIDRLSALPGAEPDIVEALMNAGVMDYDDVVDYGVEGLIDTARIKEPLAEQLFAAAKTLLEGGALPEE